MDEDFVTEGVWIMKTTDRAALDDWYAVETVRRSHG